MNEKFYLGTSDETYSRIVETGMEPTQSINDLSDEEKAEFFKD